MNKVQKFSNPNAITLPRWILLKNDSLKIITFYFLSSRYFTNNRHFAIFEQSTKIRIVVLGSLNIPFFDRLMLKSYKIIFLLLSKKFSRYQFVVGNNFELAKFLQTNVAIDLDDITYTEEEIELIHHWEENIRKSFKTTKIIVTSDHAKNYLINKKVLSQVEVVPQCYSGVALQTLSYNKDNQRIKFCYISPLIVTSGDRLQGHKNWDITHFIDNIFPAIKAHSSLELHLIGTVGRHAQRKLASDNVIFHGPQNTKVSRRIMSECHFGLYPRPNDNFRQAHKIVEYIAAGIPIIAYKLVDTNLVMECEIGWLADNPEQFISLLLQTKINSIDYLEKEKRVLGCQKQFSANYMSKKIEQILVEK